jgi:hypothetical protein
VEAAAERDPGLNEARRLLEMGLRCLGLRGEELATLKKGDESRHRGAHSPASGRADCMDRPGIAAWTRQPGQQLCS